VLPLEQRRVAGREPPSEQRSEGQPGYLGESQVHHLRHPAPISATQPTDLLLTGIRVTRSRAMDILATRDTPLPPVLRAMDTQVTRVGPVTPVLRAMDIQATRDTPPTPGLRDMDTRTARSILPTPVPVPVMDIPCLVIPETALRRTGRLGPSTLSSLLAEFRPKVRPSILDAVHPWQGRNASVKSIAPVRVGDPRSPQRSSCMGLFLSGRPRRVSRIGECERSRQA
jgi:hypothetical protein